MTIRASGRPIATLPNCDGCGQFTSNPDVRRGCDSYSDYHICWELLLCPRCAERDPEPLPADPDTIRAIRARKDRP